MTTLVDNFNRADNASSLGTTSDGLAIWVAHRGTFGISSNQANCAANAHPSVAAVETNVADGTVQATIVSSPASPNFTGLSVRVTDGNNLIIVGSGFIQKIVAGSAVDIQVPGPTFSAGDVVAVTMTGSSFEMFVNGVSQTTFTETFNQTATKHGLASAGTWDTFSAPYSAAAAAARPSPIHAARRQALMRAAVR